MNLSDYLSQERGRAAALAKALGTHAPNVTDWAKGDRPVPIKYGAQIEQLTAGLVTRQELFPNDWERIWPELIPRRRRKAVDAASGPGATSTT